MCGFVLFAEREWVELVVVFVLGGFRCVILVGVKSSR